MFKYSVEFNKDNSVNFDVKSYYCPVTLGDIITDDCGDYFKVIEVIHEIENTTLRAIHQYENRY